ncbi:unnamed protein product [Clonostachys rosea]|uniref:Uncharacterized protein n=1 Tax=Bionectria ochroleuca TaxID=29856 RepID=A0ABY6USF4_BIOOC|nr:unnamed protein product [Clonostachys rosea]
MLAHKNLNLVAILALGVANLGLAQHNEGSNELSPRGGMSDQLPTRDAKVDLTERDEGDALETRDSEEEHLELVGDEPNQGRGVMGIAVVLN